MPPPSPHSRSERRNTKPRSMRTPLPCSFVVNHGHRPKPIHGRTALPSRISVPLRGAPAASAAPSTRVGTKTDEQHRDGDVDADPTGEPRSSTPAAFASAYVTGAPG